PSMREGYLALLEHFQTRFAAVISEVARADHPIVIHCQGGRDRTGLAVALILQLAGVDPEAIAADHARSDESWAPTIEEWFAEAPGLVVPRRSAGGYRLYGLLELNQLRSLRELRRRHDVELTDVAFAARLEREPELRAAVETWLAGTQLSALDWEQRKHERLLA